MKHEVVSPDRKRANLWELEPLGEAGFIFSNAIHGGRFQKTVGLVLGAYDYRGTSLIRNRNAPGPCNKPMPRALWLS